MFQPCKVVYLLVYDPVCCRTVDGKLFNDTMFLGELFFQVSSSSSDKQTGNLTQEKKMFCYNEYM